MFPITTKIANTVYVVLSTYPHNNSQRVNNTIPLHSYDATTDKWNVLAQLPSAVTNTNGASAVAIQNQLYVVGGQAKLCLTYKPVSDTWIILQSPSLGHNYGAAVIFKGKIMILGGSSDQIEEYDLLKDEWQISHIKLPCSMNYHHAVTL
jgi:hypothetical protein